MKTYTFNVFNNYAAEGVVQALKEYNRENAAPIVVCVGSDLVVGDSLGPLVGTFLRQRNAGAYIYGTLNPADHLQGSGIRETVLKAAAS